MTFQDLGLCPPILSALKDLGYEKPSPIQEKAIPPALKGRDVLGCAQTGTGKTCAFATPILQQLYERDGGAGAPRPTKGGRPIRALILTPTRELALQIQESFEHYGKNLPLRSAVIFGGVGQQPQVDKLKAGVDILVATPGRLEDLHNQGFIHVEKLEIFVLDEADRMLDMGFIHDVKKILTWLPKKKQTLFFSATMPPEVQGLVDQLLTNPVKVAVDPVSSPVEVIDQRLFYVDRGNKSKLLAMLVKHPDVKNALIFTRTKHGANKVAADLQKAGIPSAAIHGNKSQTARQQALADFKSGKVKALVATDIAARGIDIEELSHVFNYNLPDVPETYVHRIGRTGRAGHGGTAVSFCEFGEKELLAPIEKLLKKPIPVVEGHPYPMEIFEAPKRDKHGKIVNADDAEARQAARERKAQRQKEKAAPKQEKPAQQQGRQKPAQTISSGKRASAGYKPSKTLDEALTAMAPKSSRKERPARASAPAQKQLTPEEAEKQAAFERWMAEEQAIQAKYYRDALEGEEVMDATARLLAPKGEHSRIGELGLERGAVLASGKRYRTTEPTGETAQGRKRPADQPESEGKRPGYAANASLTQQKRKEPAKSQQKKPKGEKGRQPTPQKAKAPKSPQGGRGIRTAPSSPTAAQPPQGGRGIRKAAEPPTAAQQPAPKKKRPDRRGGRGRPMEVTLRLGSQKDSTEQQGSLMRPYYFNPDED